MTGKASNTASEPSFENLHRVVADSTYDWEYLQAPEGQFLYVSPSCRRITGYPAEQFLADPGLYLQIVHPDDRPRVAAHQCLPSDSGDISPLEFRIVRPDGGVRWIGHVCREVLDAQHRRVGLRGSNRDITYGMNVRITLQRELAHREALQRLVTEISTRFIRTPPEGVDAEIDRALAEVGQFTGVQRCYVFQFRDGTRLMDNTHEWCAAGVAPYLAQLQGVPVERFPWFARQILAREVVYVPDVAHLPPSAAAERAEFESEGTRSLINVPMAVGEELLGFLGLDTTAEVKLYSHDTIVLLQITGEIFADALLRRRVEHELHRSQTRLQSIFRGAPIGMGVVRRHNAHRTILEVNDALCDMVGRPPSELVGSDARILYPSQEEYDQVGRRKYEQIRLTGVGAVETQWVRSDGQRVEVLLSSAPIDPADPSLGVSFAAVDITDRKHAEDLLRGAKQELERRVAQRTEELSRMVEALQAEVERRKLAEDVLRGQRQQLRALTSELTLAEQRERSRLARVLHDGLQQTLVGANLRVELLERSDNPATRAAAADVKDLISEAIQTSRSLTAELSPPILYEGGLVEAMEWLARWMRDRHGLTVGLDVHGDASAVGQDMIILLFQSVRELLFNVVKHAGVQEARVEVAVEEQHVRVTVKDHGRGFDPQQLSAAGDAGGGMGLFGIRERLGYMGGEVRLESTRGQGVRITLIAPVAAIPPPPQPGKAAAAVPTARAPHAPAPPACIRVVLVDDHIVMRQGLSALLETEPDMLVVGEASDGESAVRVVREKHPDIVLMDISMPGMNGIEATRAIHSELPEVGVIGLSMFQEEEQARRMCDAGGAIYLTKTGPSATLLAAIRDLAHRSGPPHPATGLPA